MLTDKTIEIQKGKKEFIYQTSNSGNNWELKNPKQVKGKFKDELDSEQVESLLTAHKMTKEGFLKEAQELGYVYDAATETNLKSVFFEAH
jgi:hypothetical protein